MNNMARAQRNRAHGATLKVGDTVAYTRLFLESMADKSHKSHSRRGTVLGPALLDMEQGHNPAVPITKQIWLIEIRWHDGEIGRINPANVCKTRSVPFID